MHGSASCLVSRKNVLANKTLRVFRDPSLVARKQIRLQAAGSRADTTANGGKASDLIFQLDSLASTRLKVNNEAIWPATGKKERERDFRIVS
jgi:hypothetical protein